jgi:hypothetical protein
VAHPSGTSQPRVWPSSLGGVFGRRAADLAHHIDERGWTGKGVSDRSVPNRWPLVLVLMMVCSLLPTAQAQIPTAPGVEIDCENKQPELDVHPLNDPVVEITCTVRNPSSFQESILVEKEWDGLEVDMMLEEDTFELGPDEEEDFKVTFSGQTRLSSSLSYDFTLVATVTNVGMLDWPEALTSNASVSGDLNIATFGMVDLEISDKSTRTMQEGDEIKISFQFQNNGNDDDKIRVTILNAAELEEAGFSFPGGTFVAENVVEDGSSTVRELTVRSPSDVVADERFQMVFQAESENDDEAPVSEITISIQLEAGNTAGGLGGGLEEVDKDTVVLYGSIGAAGLFGLIFVVALAKALRRRANSQPMYVPPVDVEDEPDEDDLDLSELDDLFADEGGEEDFDAVFADL